MTRDLAAWLAVIEQRHPVEIELGLERCGKIYRALGQPRPAGKIVTIAGTNGKGSTVGYLDAALRSLGHTVATYTSPHIRHFNERIRVDGKCVGDDELLLAFEAVEDARRDVPLSFFEFTTLAAFFLFARAQPDFAILEIGLGGRLDAVNLVDCDCAVITPIDLDHQEYLGSDRDRIGSEKAAIMRPGKPAVCGDLDPPDSVLQHAAGIGVRLQRIGIDFTLRKARHGQVEFRGSQVTARLPAPPNIGSHQLDNLAMALAVMDQLTPDWHRCLAQVGEGIAAAHFQGRLEVVREQPRLVLDVGHNPLAAQVVAAFLRENPPQGACRCVIGMLSGKDAASCAVRLGPFVNHWYCGSLAGPRARSADDLGAQIRKAVPGSSVSLADNIGGALQAAWDASEPADTILVFGSFLTVEAALDWLDQKIPLPSGGC